MRYYNQVPNCLITLTALNLGMGRMHGAKTYHSSNSQSHLMHAGHITEMTGHKGKVNREKFAH